MRKKRVCLFVFLVILFLGWPDSVFGFGIGECHTSSEIDNPLINWVYPSDEVAWRVIEPARGQYNFAPIDKLISEARRNGKKVWLQVLTHDPRPGTTLVPDWAKMADPRDGKVMRVDQNNMPISWDPKYLDYMTELLAALAARYEKPEYEDVIEAVIIMGGGSYGEMGLPGKYCVGDINVAPGEKIDAEDPNNLYVKEMARVFLGSESRSLEIAQKDSSGWVFDSYFIRSVENLIDIYGLAFTKYPIVLQLGTGISCQKRVYSEAVAYGYRQYGSRFIAKINNWGSFSGLDPVSDSFMAGYSNRIRVGYEVGHPKYFCSKEYSDAHPREVEMSWVKTCYWATQAEAVVHNNRLVAQAVLDKASFACLMGEVIGNSNRYPLDYQALTVGLVANINALPPPTTCPGAREGNLSCDLQGLVNEADMGLLLLSWTTTGLVPTPLVDTSTADFVTDGKVNEIDLAVLLRNWRTE